MAMRAGDLTIPRPGAPESQVEVALVAVADGSGQTLASLPGNQHDSFHCSNLAVACSAEQGEIKIRTCQGALCARQSRGVTVPWTEGGAAHYQAVPLSILVELRREVPLHMKNFSLDLAIAFAQDLVTEGGTGGVEACAHSARRFSLLRSGHAELRQAGYGASA